MIRLHVLVYCVQIQNWEKRKNKECKVVRVVRSEKNTRKSEKQKGLTFPIISLFSSTLVSGEKKKNTCTRFQLQKENLYVLET